MFNSYLNKKDNTFILPSKPFEVIINTLICIYGEANIINPFLTKSSEALINNLKEIGASDTQIDHLITDINSFYNWYAKDNNTKTILLNRVEKDLIDLLFIKENKRDKTILSKYFNQLYIDENPNPAYKLYIKLISADPEEISRYLKNKIDNPILFDEIQEMLLSESLYNKYGFTLEEIKKMSNDKIRQINDKILNDINSANESGGRTKENNGELELVLTNGKGMATPVILISIVILLLILIGVMLFLVIGR